MSQNSLRLSWTRKEVDDKLKDIMEDIHDSCVKYGENEDGSIDYIKVQISLVLLKLQTQC